MSNNGLIYGLIAAVGLSYLVSSTSKKQDSFSELQASQRIAYEAGIPINSQNTAQENIQIVKDTQKLIKEGKTQKTPTKPVSGNYGDYKKIGQNFDSKLHIASVNTSKEFQNKLIKGGYSGVIPTKITNTGSVTPEIAKILKGSTSVFTGKVRV